MKTIMYMLIYTHMANIGNNAAEACRAISSEAENIKARGDAVGGVLGFLNPKNWGSQNETKQQIKNILGVDMSTDSITNIKNTCNNIFTGVQTNTIDVSNCPICETQKCVIKGVRQTNVIKSQQMCGANAIIDVLKQKKGDFQSLAALKAIQDAKGIAAGNTSSSDICNYTDVNMSSKDYIDALSNCGNTASSVQSNTLKGCADIIDVIQRNDYNNYQKCIAGATFTSEAKADMEAILEGDGETGQKSEGTDLFGFFNAFGNYIYYIVGGVISSSFISCCCCIVIFALIMFGHG
jgi:hypothetical protein